MSGNLSGYEADSTTRITTVIMLFAFKEMAATLFTHGREKCHSGRRNNEPRIRIAEGTQIKQVTETCKQQIKYSIILGKINRTILPGFENIQCLEA